MTFLARRIGVVLIDLSGTIHIEDAAIPGSIEALQRLRCAKNLKLKFVTNTTKESKQTLLSRLTNIGFGIEETEIFTSLSAVRQLVINNNLQPFYILSEDAMQDFSEISHSGTSHNAVVVGLAPKSFDYETMTNAFRLLINGAPLIAIHKSRYYKRSDGLALGPGAYVTALEYSAGVKAEVVGKPEKSFFLAALQELGATPEDAVMIGDDACDDVEGAMKAGLQGCLVRTGKYRSGDESMADIKPTIVADNFPEVVDIILKHNEAFD